MSLTKSLGEFTQRKLDKLAHRLARTSINRINIGISLSLILTAAILSTADHGIAFAKNQLAKNDYKSRLAIQKRIAQYHHIEAKKQIGLNLMEWKGEFSLAPVTDTSLGRPGDLMLVGDTKTIGVAFDGVDSNLIKIKKFPKEGTATIGLKSVDEIARQQTPGPKKFTTFNQQLHDRLGTRKGKFIDWAAFGASMMMYAGMFTAAMGLRKRGTKLSAQQENAQPEVE